MVPKTTQVDPAGSTTPRFQGPMLAERRRPVGPEHAWVHERKLDGERIMAVRDGRALRLWTRNQNEATANYPELVAALEAQPIERFVIDGEVVAFDAEGKTSFERLQRRMHRSDRFARRATGVAVHYMVFDCLNLDGVDLRMRPLVERKQLLAEAFAFGPQVLYLPHRAGRGFDALEAACRAGWEGLMAKRADAAYASGRTPAWCKLKCERSDTFHIVGYTPPQGGRVGIGALMVAEPGPDGLRYAGKVGSGLSDALLAVLADSLARIGRETPPVVDPPETQGRVHWVEPVVACEVRYTERTRDGRLRHPVFKGIRRDVEV